MFAWGASNDHEEPANAADSDHKPEPADDDTSAIPRTAPTYDEEDSLAEAEQQQEETNDETTGLLSHKETATHGSISVTSELPDDHENLQDPEEEEEGDESFHHIHSDYLLLPETMAYKWYQWFSGVAALLAFGMLLLHVVSFGTLQTSSSSPHHGNKFFTPNLIRVFVMMWTGAFFLAELPVTSHFFAPLLGLQNWVYRGFLWCFVAAVAAETAEAALYSHYPKVPGFSEHVTALTIKAVAACMFAVGGLYMILGVCCLRGVVENVMDHYQEHVQDRLKTAEEDLEIQQQRTKEEQDANKKWSEPV
uniref:Uncharacterized protein n=1 Tax=Entomoneis paludosa TaxID=265537 RepID=A0A7S2YT90_9STRA